MVGTGFIPLALIDAEITGFGFRIFDLTKNPNISLAIKITFI